MTSTSSPQPGLIGRFIGGPLDGGMLIRPAGVALPAGWSAGAATYTLEGTDYYLDGVEKPEPIAIESTVVPPTPVPVPDPAPVPEGVDPAPADAAPDPAA